MEQNPQNLGVKLTRPKGRSLGGRGGAYLRNLQWWGAVNTRMKWDHVGRTGTGSNNNTQTNTFHDGSER